MTTSDLDPDALVDWADVKATQLLDGIWARGDVPFFRSDTSYQNSVEIVAEALREAEQRGAKAEHARIYHTDSFGSGATLTAREPGASPDDSIKAKEQK